MLRLQAPLPDRYTSADPETLLTAPLAAQLDETLRRGEQALLFLNRRGFAPFLLCCGCGEAPRLPKRNPKSPIKIAKIDVWNWRVLRRMSCTGLEETSNAYAHRETRARKCNHAREVEARGGSCKRWAIQSCGVRFLQMLRGAPEKPPDT